MNGDAYVDGVWHAQYPDTSKRCGGSWGGGGGVHPCGTRSIERGWGGAPTKQCGLTGNQTMVVSVWGGLRVFWESQVEMQITRVGKAKRPKVGGMHWGGRVCPHWLMLKMGNCIVGKAEEIFGRRQTCNK